MVGFLAVFHSWVRGAIHQVAWKIEGKGREKESKRKGEKAQKKIACLNAAAAASPVIYENFYMQAPGMR